MKKMIGIGGMPGTGKTTLINEFMKKASDWEPKKPIDLLDSLYSKTLDCWVLGKYAPWYEIEGYAQGTDKLSMASPPKAIEFLSDVKSNVVFEGDRLFIQGVLENLVERTDVACKFFVLSVPEDILAERYADRGSEQNEKFIKGRKTKYSNLLKNFGLAPFMKKIKHVTEEDTKNIVEKFDV